MNNGNIDPIPRQFQFILEKCCSTDEQRQCLLNIRNWILANNGIKEFSDTRHIIYGKKDSKPYIEIMSKERVSNPMLLLTLPRIDIKGKQTTQNCRYLAEINSEGMLSDGLKIYQIGQLKYDKQNRTISKVLETLGQGETQNLSNEVRLQRLIELAINLNSVKT